MEKVLWDVKEAASYLGIAPSTIYELCAKNKLPFIKLGGRKMFRKDLLDAHLESSIITVK